MSFSDPIADLLTRIRNAGTAEHRYVDVPWSRMKESITKILKEEGYIADYVVRREEHRTHMRVTLKYARGRQPVIQGLRRHSRPGRRWYVNAEQIPYVFDGMGIAIVSTSAGIKTDKQARQQNVGGELLCSIW